MKFKAQEDKFTDSIALKFPPRIGGVIDDVAKKKCTTPTELVRRYVVERLEADGLMPVA